MITLDDFRTASFERKCDLVTADTNFIVARQFGDAKVYLFHKSEFYIEVYYSTKYKKVLMINAFDDAKGLHPYAEAVSLAELGF